MVLRTSCAHRLNSLIKFKISAALESADAAPLLCAGITVYAPLRAYMTRSAMKVGVIGIGGLGHLAVKYAKAMGAEVTVFSISPDKETEAKTFGAHHFHIWENADEMKKAHSSQDLIINTVFSTIDFEAALNLLANNGTLCLVGMPTCSIDVPVLMLVSGQKTIASSLIGAGRFMREMLDFSATHKSTPKIETMPLS